MSFIFVLSLRLIPLSLVTSSVSVGLLYWLPSCGHSKIFSFWHIVLLSYFVKRCLLSESPRSWWNVACFLSIVLWLSHFGCWREFSCWAVRAFVVAKKNLSSSCVHLFLLIPFQRRFVIKSCHESSLCHVLVALIVERVIQLPLLFFVFKFHDVISNGRKVALVANVCPWNSWDSRRVRFTPRSVSRSVVRIYIWSLIPLVATDVKFTLGAFEVEVCSSHLWFIPWWLEVFQ
jgi:hypothetical protein